MAANWILNGDIFKRLQFPLIETIWKITLIQKETESFSILVVIQNIFTYKNDYHST